MACTSLVQFFLLVSSSSSSMAGRFRRPRQKDDSIDGNCSELNLGTTLSLNKAYASTSLRVSYSDCSTARHSTAKKVRFIVTLGSHILLYPIPSLLFSLYHLMAPSFPRPLASSLPLPPYSSLRQVVLARDQSSSERP